MARIAGAILLIGSLVIGPDRENGAWGMLCGFCIAAGMLLLLVNDRN